jgi:formylglycine-generating enzyme required for sulfatase activity
MRCQRQHRLIANLINKKPAYSEDLDPLGPEFGEHKVIRGGCYFQGVSRLRCASRIKRLPKLVDDVTGFRCVAKFR